jgi:hypothetical protein
MLLGKNKSKLFIFCLITLSAIFLICIPSSHAQYWGAIPPYNILWPLWSPALSPVNPVTGVSTPLLTSLTNDTILPKQPALVWDPSQEFPWLLYNVPSILGGGLTYFAPYYGFNSWPPSSLTDPLTGAPAPISLPLGFGALPPTDLETFGPYFNAGNTTYSVIYPPSIFGFSFGSFLTPAEVWGLPPI